MISLWQWDRPMTVRKTHALASALAGVGLILGVLSAAAQERFDGVTLRVATYGGGFDKAVLEGTEKQFQALGGKIEIVQGSPTNHLAKLIAARGSAPPFDVFDVADNTLSDTMEGDFLEEIDLAKIPNVKELLPSQYSKKAIAGWVSQDGIMYNTEKFKELGIPAPTGYLDLLNPKLKDRVMSIDLTTPGAIHMIVAVSKAAGGSESNLDAGFDFLKKLRALKYYKVGSEGLLNLKVGEVYAVTTSAGFAAQGRRTGVPVAFVHPQVGKYRGFNKVNYVGIAKGTPNKRAAEFFIDAYLAEESQYHLAKVRGIIPVNGKARVRLGDDPLLKEFFMLSDAEVGNMMRVDWNKIDLTTFGDKWNRAIAR
jgi:putative spermidine/putrescine transport system substrate-binding protein